MSEQKVVTLPLVFEIPLNEISVTKDENGREYYNLPYRVTGKLGNNIVAFLKGSRISIPKVLEDRPAKAKEDKPKLSKADLEALTK